MYTIQLGQLVLNLEIFVYLLCGAVGVLAIRMKTKPSAERDNVVSTAFNAVLLWLLVWKGSMLLFQPTEVFANPSSLLYFSGGVKGKWLASAIAAAYLLLKLFKFKVSKKETLELMTIMVLSSFVVFVLVEESFKLVGSGATQVGSGIQKGQFAPDFDLTDMNGNRVNLSDFRGSIVFLNFWATWCPPCKAEMPHMERIHKNYKDKGVAVLAVNVTTTEGKLSDVKGFVTKMGLTFPIVLDIEGVVNKQYQIMAYPTTFMIDKQGVIRQRFLGAVSYDTMKQMIP